MFNVITAIVISAAAVLGTWLGVHEIAQNQDDATRALLIKNGVNPSLAVGASAPISSLTEKTTLQGSDTMVIVDNGVSPATTKKITAANATSGLQTWFDGRYQTLLVNSAGLRGALSDETGSGGAAVFATGPTISGAQLTSTPTLTDPVLNGTITGTGVVGIAQGGTGSTTKTSALNALLPRQDGNSGKYLQTNATDVSWSSLSFPLVNGASSTVLQNDGSGNLIWDYPQRIIFASSTAVLATSTGEVILSSAGYTLARQMFVPLAGTVRVNFNCKDVNGAFTYYCRLYRNGIAIGTEHTGNSNSYVNFSEDATTTSPFGDYIQVYAHGVGGTNTYVGTFYIMGTTTIATSTYTIVPQI